MFPSAATAYQPISLGCTCEAKFQICRNLYFSFYGRKREEGFRLQMLPEDRSQALYGWHTFDWQRTPFSALLSYLEQDFAGVFERADLYKDGPFVLNVRYGTEHAHQFPGFEESWTDADIDRAYDRAKASHERRADRFRDLMRMPGPYLYIWTASYYPGTDHLPPADQVQRLLDLLSARGPDHRFHLLMVANPGKDADYAELDGRLVTKVFKAEKSDKPLELDWEGNDLAWEAIMAPFTLTVHDADAQRMAGKARLAVQAAQEPARRPLLSRLLGR